MNSIARHLLVAAVRKWLPEAMSKRGTSLALRPSDASLTLRPDSRQASQNAPASMVYAPPVPPQVIYAAPPAPPRRFRKVVVTETYVTEKEW